MKLLWTGTDSLMLVNYSMRSLCKKPYWWMFRKMTRLMDFFIQSHYCVSENVADNVRRFGTRKPISILVDPAKYTEEFDKVEHNGFNVLYYFPRKGDRKFNEWLYGWDVFLEVKDTFTVFNFIIVDGSDEMAAIYPITDFYLRCNRHDGQPRMVIECEAQGIPYYWSRTDPDYNAICIKIYENLLYQS